jgi:hypothetical protein
MAVESVQETGRSHSKNRCMGPDWRSLSNVCKPLICCVSGLPPITSTTGK